MSEQLNEKLDQLAVMNVKNQQEAASLVGKLFSVAQPGAVFSKPIMAGDKTVITASEVSVGMGFGYGGGGGTETEAVEGEVSQDGSQREQDVSGGLGGGGGGGGFSKARPVAVITIGQKGVQVEPIVDVTQIVLAFFMMLGSMLMMFNKMRKATKGK